MKRNHSAIARKAWRTRKRMKAQRGVEPDKPWPRAAAPRAKLARVQARPRAQGRATPKRPELPCPDYGARK
jgi:hypothetical protein